MPRTGETHVFVYGTLREGGGAEGLLRGCARVGAGAVRGRLYDLGAYPALVLAAGEGAVRGEVWGCPAAVLPRLDAYEGVAEGLFRRVRTEAGGVECWVYVAGPALEPALAPENLIGSGDWLAR